MCVALDKAAGGLHQRNATFPERRLVWAATFARPEARSLGLSRRPVKSHVLAPRTSRRARRPTIDIQTDAFTEKLKGVRVAIAFGEEAATSRDGRELLNLSVRLAARLYPSLAFVTVPAGERLADDLILMVETEQSAIDEVTDHGGGGIRNSFTGIARYGTRCGSRTP